MRAAVRCAAPLPPPALALPPPALAASLLAQRRAAPQRAPARHAAAILPRHAQGVAPPRHRRCAALCAATNPGAGGGAAADADDDGDADARAAMNEVCSRAVRAMLAGDASAARALRDELLAMVAELASLRGMADSAEDELFLTLVAEMLDHKLLPGADALSGDRARAFFAVLAAVEGEWRLAMPGQAEGPPDGELKFSTYEDVLRKRQQQRFAERFGPLPPPAAKQPRRAAAVAAAKDAWQLLGVERGASKADITAAYRQKARELHPDVSPLPDATALFAAVAAAYEQLTSDAPGGAGDAEVDSWPEFARTPKKESPRSAARKSPAAGDAPASAGPQVGDLVEYPLPARDRSGDRVAGVALLVSRNCDRGDAKKLPPDMLDICECEPLRQRERGGAAWVPDDLAPPCFPRMGQLKVLDRSAITYLPAHDAWAFSLPLSPGCSGPAHDEEIML